MKKYYILTLILVLVLSFASFSEKITKDTNLASGKKAYGTFSYSPFVTDGKIKGVAAVSGNLYDSPQYLTIDLGMQMYLDRIKIFWDKGALSHKFDVRVSKDSKYWVEEARGLDASFGILDKASDAVAINVSLKRAIENARFIQIKIPAGTKVTNKKGDYVKITEVEVYPALNQKFAIERTNAYVVTGTSCMIKYKTSIGAASGTLLYGEDPQQLDKVARNSESGVDSSVPISGLEPKKTYFYQIRTTDHYGKTVSSKIEKFTTFNENVALNKKVEGTFTNYSSFDKYVKPGNKQNILSRVTDGMTSYFTSMATSGPVPASDQYVIVDLGKRYKMNNIVSYWRKLAYPENLTVQISDDKKAWKTIEDKVNVGKGVFSRSDAGDPMKIVSVKGDSGRYIKLLVKRGTPFFHKHSDWDFVQLMEVEVYTD